MLRSKGILPEYNFAPKDGTGLAAIMPAVSTECLNLLQNLLTYDPDYRFVLQNRKLQSLIILLFSKIELPPERL